MKLVVAGTTSVATMPIISVFAALIVSALVSDAESWLTVVPATLSHSTLSGLLNIFGLTSDTPNVGFRPATPSAPISGQVRGAVTLQFPVVFFTSSTRTNSSRATGFTPQTEPPAERLMKRIDLLRWAAGTGAAFFVRPTKAR